MDRHSSHRTIGMTPLALLWALCSCAPALTVPATDGYRSELVDSRESWVSADSLSDLSAVRPAAWWKVFGESRIDSMVHKAIENNLDIRKAMASVRELSFTAWQARSDRLPSLTLSGSYQRLHSPEPESSSGPVQGDRENETYTASIAASFELDLWGRLSALDEAARADLLASKESLRTVIQSIVAETVTLALQTDALEKRILIAEENIASARKSRDIVRARYDRGIVSILDLKQAERALAQAEADLPQLRQDLGTTRQKLAVLLGGYPDERDVGPVAVESIQRLSPVPAGLPSGLLESRPDIRAAEARMNAAAARVGAARSALFPRISLTGSDGYTSDALSDLFTPANLIWNLAAGITQPLFDSGKLITAKDAAWARYESAGIDYARTVLQAFSEVESALLAGRRQSERREKVLALVDRARAVERIASDRYDRGLTGYLTVLDARQARYQAEDALVLSDLSLMLSRVSLHRALGGEWILDDESEKDDL